MPLYDYDCAACGRRFEVIHGVHAEGPTNCPHCGSGPVRKAFAAPAVHFKGSGWAKKERRATAAKASGAGSDASGDSDKGASDSAGETAAASTAATKAGSTNGTSGAAKSGGSSTGASSGTPTGD